MEFSFYLGHCIFLELSIALDTVFIEVYFFCFLIDRRSCRLVDEGERKQTFVIKANLFFLFFLKAPEYFPAIIACISRILNSLGDSKRLSTLRLVLEVLIFLFFQFTSLHVPGIDIVVEAECMELITHLRSK